MPGDSGPSSPERDDDIHRKQRTERRARQAQEHWVSGPSHTENTQSTDSANILNEWAGGLGIFGTGGRKRKHSGLSSPEGNDDIHGGQQAREETSSGRQVSGPSHTENTQSTNPADILNQSQTRAARPSDRLPEGRAEELAGFRQVCDRIEGGLRRLRESHQEIRQGLDKNEEDLRQVGKEIDEYAGELRSMRARIEKRRSIGRTLFLRSLLSSEPVSSDTSHHIDFEYNIDDNAIIEHFRSNERKRSKKELSIYAVKRAIDDIRKENYGVIDLNNDEHVELLYYYISNRAEKHLRDSQTQTPSQEIETENEDEKWQKEKLASPDVENTYKTAFLGAGTANASYIECLGRNFDHTQSILIGLPEPWQGERGPGVLGQPEHMITPKRQFSAGIEIDDKWPNRRYFSQLIEDVFQKYGIKREIEPLKSLEYTGQFWRITYEKDGNDRTIYAKNVICGLGQGGQSSSGIDESKVAKTPEEVMSKERRIMNMDIFSRVADGLEHVDQKKETVIIVVGGGNVTADIAFLALKSGYRVKWVVGKRGANFLPGLPNYAVNLPFLKYKLSIEKDSEQKQKYEQQIKEFDEKSVLEDLYRRQDKEIFQGVAQDFKTKEFDHIYFTRADKLEQTDNGVVVKLPNNEEVEGDYLVYGMGQDESPLALLDKTIRENLVSCYDLNQRFKLLEKADGTESTAAALALKTKDGSLTIIGAMARSIKDEQKGIMDSLPNNAATQTRNRSAIEADTNFMPYDINKRAIFDTDDITMLAFHISARYPAIADYEASPPLVDLLAEMIIQSRRQKGIKSKPDSLLPDGPNILPYPPHGREFQETWEKALSRLEEYLQQNKKAG